jgi:hypothetical protein
MSSEPKPVPPNHWMVSEGGQQQGPYTLEQIKQMIAEGRLPALALLWTPGMSEWKPWNQVPEFQPATAEQPKATATARVGVGAAAASLLQSGYWQDFLLFRQMLTPLIIQAVFWAGLAAIGIGFLILLFTAVFGGSFVGFVLGTLAALIWLVVGTLALRIWCELLILAFRIADLLGEIRDRLPEKP